MSTIDKCLIASIRAKYINMHCLFEEAICNGRVHDLKESLENTSKRMCEILFEIEELYVSLSTDKYKKNV